MGATSRTRTGASETKRATYEDLEKVPPERVAELIDGELITSPRPAMPHANASSAIGGLLFTPYRLGVGGPGGWHILDEPELRFGSGSKFDVLVPDPAGWRVERLPRIPNVPYMTLAPDWVCEVLSASTEKVDRHRKLPIYLRNGVRHVWLVSPKHRLLEVYRRSEAGWVLVGQYEGEDKAGAEPFEAVELELVHLWSASEEEPAP